MSVDSEKIKDLVRRAVTESTVKLTHGAVEAFIKKQVPVRGRDIRKAIASLVNDGELAYSYTYGSSFIERSFGRPIRVTERFVLMPPGISFYGKDGDIPIIIEPGVSFGMGDHPTTRLALAGLEIPPAVTGRDLMALYANPTAAWREDVYYDHPYGHKGRIPRTVGVRGTRYVYTRYIDPKPPFEQLFDLRRDPDQLKNLALEPAHSELLRNLRTRCDTLGRNVGKQ